jgi:putative IMPACT (imprinted ancient) family translation regulator
MLAVLLNAGVGEIVVVVTRYFGGIKLGTGGLVRAYTAAVQHALRELATVERVDWIEARVVVSYAQVDAVRRAIDSIKS